MNSRLLALSSAIALLTGCSHPETKEPKSAPVAYFKADPATAGVLTGTVRFAGRKPAAKVIDMDQEPECAKQHKNGRVAEEAVFVDSKGSLRNVFVYVKTGMGGRVFEAPAAPVVIDQKGCWFEPRVLGIQTGQKLEVRNSDPVTHNIHPLAQINREWNQSQGPGDAPLSRRFINPEILIPVKCNIHRWMHAFIGVVDHPYFAVTETDGSFEMKNVPPGKYTIAAIHEVLGSREQTIDLEVSGKASLNFTFKGE